MEHISETIARLINKKQVDTQERLNRSVAQGIVEGTIQETERVIRNQQAKVLASGKYERPVHRSNHTMDEWINHQREELADSLIYLQCIDETHQEIAELMDHAIRSLDKGDAHTSRRLLVEGLSRLRGGETK